MTAIAPYSHIYKGQSEIRFEAGEKLYVEIYTPRLFIRSVQPSDVDLYEKVYGDAEVMAKFADGKTKSREYVQNRIENIWDKRWRNHDPYNSFALFDRTTNEFVGTVVLGHGDLPGTSELAGLGRKEFWNQKFASEAIEAIVKEYAPATLLEGYLLDGEPLREIVSTSRTDNPASIKLLESVGMQIKKTEEKFGALRHHYSLDVSTLSAPTLQKTEDLFSTRIDASSAA